MIPPHSFAHVTAQAFIPEQIVSYVMSVGGSRPVLYGDCIAYDSGGHTVLVAYAPGILAESAPITADGETADAAKTAMEKAVKEILRDGAVKTLTVLGPSRPRAAPKTAASRQDAYYFLALPAKPGTKLRNMLRRGERECAVREEAWNAEHEALVKTYCDSRPLEEGTRRIYARIPEYLEATPDAILFAARNHTGELLAMAVGDFSPLSVACYMFAFREKNCPPGVADVLLHKIVSTAEEKGHQYVNLGLGISGGIAAFKRKWGEHFRLPCVQTSWEKNESAIVAKADPLAVFSPPSFAESVLSLFRGEARPFDCLQIEMTSFCQGKCDYCPHTTKQAAWRSRIMEDATFAALEPLIKRAKRVHLQGWGEPLLHPRFFDYAKAAIRAGSAVSTTTCGLGLTGEKAAMLVKSGLDIVAFSLSGVDEKSNAARQGAPFATVRESILLLNEAKRITGSARPYVHIAYLMLASREDAVSRLPDLMADLGVSVAVVSTLDFIAAPGHEKEAYAPGERKKVDAARELLRKTAEIAAERGLSIHYSLPGEKGGNTCGERIQSCMYIDAAGMISPCIYVNLPTDENDPHRRVFGSVHDKKSMDIWHDPNYALFRRRLAAGNPDLPCISCAKRFERVF